MTHKDCSSDLAVFCTVVHVFGLIAIFFGGLMALGLLFSLIVNDGAARAFYQGAEITFLIGTLLFLPTLKIPKKLSVRAGFLLVSMTWALTPIFCTFPLLFYFEDLSFVDAYFETMSALTTTGATIFSGIDYFPMSINLWRHGLNWIAGMGIIVFAIAILPFLGVGGMQLYKAEAPGSVKESELPPRIAQTAKALWLVYAGISFACIISLRFAGMTWFDAVCHAFAAMSLGGMSTHDNSVGFFDSVQIEIVLTTFQLIAAMNFATHFLAISKRSLVVYFQDVEAKTLLTLVFFSCIGCAAVLWHAGAYDNYFTALRHVTFNLVTIATDCGFASQDFSQWPLFVPMWMLLLSCFTTSSGSTGGGARMIRAIIMMKQAGLEFFKFIHPSAVRSVRIGDKIISHEIVASVTGFIFLYFASIVILTFTLLLSGLDFISALSAVIACFNNAGPGLNQVGPATNYASLTDFQTAVCIFTMLLGRVQIFSIIILFVPEFWRK